MEVSLSTLAQLPDDVDVARIADDACNAAFRVIADGIAAAGYGPVSGDFFPSEVATLEQVFRMFVRAMAVNSSIPCCVECGDALDGCALHGVCSACIADEGMVGDMRTRDQAARAVAARIGSYDALGRRS